MTNLSKTSFSHFFLLPASPSSTSEGKSVGTKFRNGIVIERPLHMTLSTSKNLFHTKMYRLWLTLALLECPRRGENPGRCNSSLSSAFMYTSGSKAHNLSIFRQNGKSVQLVFSPNDTLFDQSKPRSSLRQMSENVIHFIHSKLKQEKHCVT